MSVEEIWKQIPGHVRYHVSNFGRVAVQLKDGSFKGRKLNSATPYLSFSVAAPKGQKQTCFYVHNIVAKLFIGDRPPGMVIRHLDGNRYNNRVDNLCYGYPEENWNDTKKHKCHAGSRNGRSKINEREAKIIRSLIHENVSLASIARSFSISEAAVRFIKSGKHWKE